jgi:hypothetical protein
MPPRQNQPAPAPPPAAAVWAGRLEWAAVAVFILVLAARAFLPEVGYRLSNLRMAGAEADVSPMADTSELSRVLFAAALLGGCVLWLAARALRPQPLRHWWLAALIGVFAAGSLVAALLAGDKRGALDGWLEQVSLLSAGYASLHVLGQRRRFAILVIVLVAIGGTLAAKGLYQRFVEVPDRIADFEQNRSQQLRQVNLQEGSPQARMFENRLRDPAATGYFPLANVLGSLLIITSLAGVGLTIDKLRGRRAAPGDAPRARGEVDTAIVAATLTAVLTAMSAGVLLMTRSLGAALGLAAATAAFVPVWLLRARLARHWRKCVLAAAAALVLLLASVAAWGLARDRLPGLTMTFRWYYWTASAQIIADNPLGVGAENFSAAYMRYRRPQAEESVKNPHNFIMHSLAEHGLPAGAAYLAVLGGMLLLMCRPRPPAASLPGDGRSAAGGLVLLGGVAAVALASRLTLGGAAQHWGLAVIDGVLPAFVLAAALLAAAWAGDGPGRWLAAPGAASRVAVACGLGGFVLHDLVNFALFTPGAATAFWITLGASAGWRDGDAPPQPPPAGGRAGWIVAATAGLAGVVAACVLLVAPVAGRWGCSQLMVEAIARRDAAMSARWAAAAADSDKLDAQSAADAANLLMAICPPDKAQCPELWMAMRWAQEAINRDPTNAGHHRLAGAVASRLAGGGTPPDLRDRSLELMTQAVRLNPMAIRWRVELADMLLKAGRPREAIAQLDEALRIDGLLIGDSVEHLSAAERQDIAAMRNAAGG